MYIHPYKPHQPSFNKITEGCNSFAYQGAKEWNLLSRAFKDALSEVLNMLRLGYGSGMASSVTAVPATHVFYKECKSSIYVFS